jgi:hypothetical protein
MPTPSPWHYHNGQPISWPDARRMAQAAQDAHNQRNGYPCCHSHRDCSPFPGGPCFDQITSGVESDELEAIRAYHYEQ